MESHLPKLIQDLALILIAGAFVTLLFRKIKQPLVLGYIIAGFLVSPHFKLFPSVADSENIKTLADIGVIFLLFGLGLEFSFKKLFRVGGEASITALCEIIFITIAGYFTGKMLGWSTMDCLFLGGMLASSSTTIIIRAFDEMGLKTKKYTSIVFGVLVVEDIVVILLMVLLSTIAVTQNFHGPDMLFTILKLLFFLILWLVMGIYLIPTFLKKIKTMMDDEGYLILSIGLCLGMVVIATQVGFSAELGAFIMGSILAETTSAEKIEHITKPVKELFGVIFFVSVGMMIDPIVIMEYGWIVLLITVLVILGKVLSTAAGAILSGQSLKQSVQVGMSMAQIGEFAFIVATLGLSLGVISDFLFPIAVGVSAITTFTTPYMIKYSDNFYNLLEKILPEKWLIKISEYSANAQIIQAENKWKTVVKRYTTITLTNAIIVIAIVVASIKLLHPLLRDAISNPVLTGAASLIITLLICFPFLWALMRKQPDMTLGEDSIYKKGPLHIINAIRAIIGLILISYLLNNIFPSYIYIFILAPSIVFVLFSLSTPIKKLYSKIENQFMANLNSREIAELKKKSQSSNILKEAFSSRSKSEVWDVHLINLEVSQEAEYIGKTLGELSWRNDYGINVVYIKRGDKLLYAPGYTDKIFPFDHIGIIATDEQFQNFKSAFDSKDNTLSENYDIDDIIIKKLIIKQDSYLNGISIENSRIKQQTDGLVIGVEHNNERFLNPSPNTVFETDDIVWIVGERHKLQMLIK